MIYTRRKVLRDASRLFMGAVASSGLAPVLWSQPTNIWNNGIRIFFIGTWVFCKDPAANASGLLAITDPAKMKHRFPYGAWKPGGIDKNSSLRENHTSPGQAKRNAYEVAVEGSYSPAGSVSQLFQDAQQNCGFNYIAKDLTPSFLTKGIRVIYVPLPTKLFVAGYLPKGTIKSQTYTLKGTGAAAMAHVFEYQGATSLKFKGKKTLAAQDSSANFHFHTVPPDDTFHGVEMFAALVKDVFNDNSISLDAIEPDTAPILGPCLPGSFDISELDYSSIRTRTTASCAGAGVGIGG